MHERVQKALSDYCLFHDGMGAVTGKRGILSDNKFGEIASLNISDGRVPVWEQKTAYPYQTAPFTPSVASTSTNDSSAGIGSRAVYIEGHDAEGNIQEERIVLNGQAPVTSLFTWSIIYRMYVDTVGSSGTTQGTIYCGIGTFTAGVPATVFASVVNGNNQTQMCIYRVPKGYYGLITSITYTTDAGKPIRYRDELRLNDSPFDNTHPFRNVRSVNVETQYSLQLQPPGRFPELSDVRITALATQNGSRVECAFRIVLVPKELIDCDPGGAF